MNSIPSPSMNNPNTKHNENDGLLDFLTDNLIGRERDAVTRAFFEYAQGNADSAPVGIALLLTACTRQVNRAPAEIRNVVTQMDKMVIETRALEQELMQQARRSNEKVITEFKAETTRANDTLRETIFFAEAANSKARQVEEGMKSILITMSRISDRLEKHEEELKLHKESVKNVAQAAEAIKVAQEKMKELVSHLTDNASANWLTIGFLGGTLVIGTAAMFSPWAAATVFGLGMGLIQWLARQSWKFIRKQAEKLNENS